MQLRAAVPALFMSANLLLSGCGQEETNFTPELKNVEVVCADVSGLPKFTEETCADFASSVQEGLELFSKLTYNKIKPPHIAHSLLPGVVQVEDVLDKRCTDLIGAKPDDYERIDNLMFAISDAVLGKTEIDFNNTGLFIGVNAPASLCSTQGPHVAESKPEDLTDRCFDDDASGDVGYPGGRALIDKYNKPVVFGFTAADKGIVERTELRSTFAHERTHVGAGEAHPGHDYRICSTKSDTIPGYIRKNQPDLGVDIYARGPLMSYDKPNRQFISPPHLAYLGVIGEERFMTHEQPGTFKLTDPDQKGLAVLQFELTNPALKDAVASEVRYDAEPVPLRDYRLWISKVPGQDRVDIHAAPIMEQKGSDHATIVSIGTVGKGETLAIEGDVSVKLIESNPGDVTVYVRPL